MLQTTESDIPAAFPALISPDTVPSATGSEPAAAESFDIAFPAFRYFFTDDYTTGQRAGQDKISEPVNLSRASLTTPYKL